MIADAKHNGIDSGTTSIRYEKISAAKTSAPHVETELTEEALLRHHAASALAAMRELFTTIQADAMHAADPREWAERHPWGSVAAAAAAGFAAAAAMAPPKKSAANVDYAAASAAERARYEAYLNDAAQRPAAVPPPSQSAWAPLVEMAKSAAARYLMSAAQAGIAAFAATHAATAAAESNADAEDKLDPSDSPHDFEPS